MRLMIEKIDELNKKKSILIIGQKSIEAKDSNSLTLTDDRLYELKKSKGLTEGMIQSLAVQVFIKNLTPDSILPTFIVQLEPEHENEDV